MLDVVQAPPARAGLVRQAWCRRKIIPKWLLLMATKLPLWVILCVLGLFAMLNQNKTDLEQYDQWKYIRCSRGSVVQARLVWLAWCCHK